MRRPGLLSGQLCVCPANDALNDYCFTDSNADLTQCISGLVQRIQLIELNVSSRVSCHTAARISSCLSHSVAVLQRFQLEEHLIIHRHKHEMTLKFPAIKTDTAFTGEGNIQIFCFLPLLSITLNKLSSVCTA